MTMVANFNWYRYFIIIFSISCFLYGRNEYPVILVHGNAGWGRDEGLIYYWGGFQDLEMDLNSNGFDVRSASVGPFSSNWDRACELYAYIRGGRVDYGKAHSEKFGHERYGRTYEGIYKEWGEANNRGINKIHIIGHSQGGQTARLLVQLLEEGMESEVEAVLGKNPSRAEIDNAIDDGRLSGLFAGIHNDWVKSVSTFATPNDGTTMADIANYGDGPLMFFAMQLGGFTGLESIDFIDLKLDHWGLKRENGESFYQYFKRVMGSSLWNPIGGATKDFSNYDLSTYGAREMNTWVKDQANVYYFSYSCKITRRNKIGYNQIPMITLANPLFIPTATTIGAYLNYLTGITYSWLPNDGIVNTISQDAPKLGRTSNNVVKYNGDAQIGKWNDVGLLEESDHASIAGIMTSYEIGDLLEFYIDYINKLRKL